MGVPVEIWAKEIAENIYPKNVFYQGNAIDDSTQQAGIKVHVIQSGVVPVVEINAPYAAGVPVERVDTDADYNVDVFDFGPVVLRRADGAFLSYDKRASLMGDTYGVLTTSVADRIAYNWSPASTSHILRTSGAARDAYLPTQTAQRKAVAYKDILRLQTLMTVDDVDDEGRKMLVPAYLLEDLRLIPEFMDYEKLGYIQQMKDGAKGSIAGFTIYVRSRTTRYTNAVLPVKRLPDTAMAATDNLSILAWHPKYVRVSMGGTANAGIHVFENLNDAVYKGDILSGQVFAGGKISYTDERGVYILVESKV